MFDTNKYKDLWKYLRGESRPVVLYGGGNGADKVFDSSGSRFAVYSHQTALRRKRTADGGSSAL